MKEQTECKKNKSAALLTFCDNKGSGNYGQILQCYAMLKVISSFGLDPCVVLYRRKGEIDKLRHNFSIRTHLGRYLNTQYEAYYRNTLLKQGKTGRRANFDAFINKYIPRTSPCYTKNMVEYATRNSSFLICGSDQIWNPIWTDSVWQLDFGTDKQRRIAYAPSGIFYDNEEFCTIYKNLARSIEKLDYVTLREETGVNILSRYTDRPLQTAPDPTMLLSREDWNEVCSKRLIKEDYIFCYTLGRIRPYTYILQQVLKKYETEKIIYIPSELVSEGIPAKMEPYTDAGPSEFLSLIRHAKAVCTDSFHGTVFSILYGIPFFNLPRAQNRIQNYGGPERIRNLLTELGISERTLDNAGKLKCLDTPDYIPVYKRLHEIKEHNIRKLNKLLP